MSPRASTWPFGPLADRGVRPGAAERRVGVARHGAARAAQDLAVVHLLVEAAEAQLALVAGLAHHSLNLKLNVRLVHADADQLGHRLGAAAHLLAGGRHLLEIPGRLDGAHRAHDLRAVPQLESRAGGGRSRGTPGPAARRARSRSARPPRRPTRPARRARLESDRSGSIRSSGDSRRARSSTRRTSRRGSPCGRHHQVRLLVRAREVGQVGMLDDHRGVETARVAARRCSRRIRRSISAAGVTCPIVTGA